MDLLAIPFMRHVLFAGVLVALGLAPLSVYVVLRRIVFVGAAVAEISSAGVALAVLLQYEPFAVALVLTVLTFLVLSRVADSPRLPLEALIGMLYAGGSAAAVLLIVKAPRGEADIVNVLFGNILTVPVPLLWTMLVAFALVIAIQYFAYKEFLIVAYDPDMARALGIRVDLWNTIFYVTAGVAVAIAIRGVGALLDVHDAGGAGRGGIVCRGKSERRVCSRDHPRSDMQPARDIRFVLVRSSDRADDRGVSGAGLRGELSERETERVIELAPLKC